MLSAHATSTAPPDVAWRLLARPACWSSWAPHIRGAIALGSPEVELGRRGLVLVFPGAAVPVRISAKRDGHSWDWVTGPVRIRHAVLAHASGSVVSVELTAPRPVEAVLAVTYGQLLGVLMRNLAHVAAAHC